MTQREPMDNIDYEVMVAQAKKKGILMTLAVVLIASVGLYFFGVFDGGSSAVASAPQEATEGAVMDAGGFVVNLADSEKPRYAKVSFSLLLAEEVDPELAMERLPLVKDGIMPILMGMNSKELSTPEGFERVREELTSQAIKMYPRGDVVRAVVTELLVQ